jgi:hypothetical protein
VSRPGASPPTSPSCRTCCGERTTTHRPPRALVLALATAITPRAPFDPSSTVRAGSREISLLLVVGCHFRESVVPRFSLILVAFSERIRSLVLTEQVYKSSGNYARRHAPASDRSVHRTQSTIRSSRRRAGMRAVTSTDERWDGEDSSKPKSRSLLPPSFPSPHRSGLARPRQA